MLNYVPCWQYFDGTLAENSPFIEFLHLLIPLIFVFAVHIQENCNDDDETGPYVSEKDNVVDCLKLIKKKMG